MMIKLFKSVFAFVVMWTLMSCDIKAGNESPNYYGKEFEVNQVTAFDEVVKKLQSEQKVETILKVRVESVCKVKGCWMNAVSTDPNESVSFFVKFKDYGFFVPSEIVGKEAYIKGEAFKEITSVDELKHYAEDDGKSQEEIDAITEPVEEYKFIATGVSLL